MVDEDNLQGRVHADCAAPHLPAAQLAGYRRLMRADGILRLGGQGRSKPLDLLVDSNGWLGEGEYRGDSYDPSALQKSAASLDHSCWEIPEATKIDRHCSAVRALGDGWWLVEYGFR
jgi:hypothetical protein